MNAVLTQVDAWILALVLAATMLAGWGVGWWWRRRQTKAGRPADRGKLPDASATLLSLLLGFTFAMALSKHEQQRLQVVSDSNAIGDFYTCASVIKEPVRTKLKVVIQTYVERLLALKTEQPDETVLTKRLDEFQDMQGRMQALVAEAVESGTPATVPLVNTLNEVTSGHAALLAAYRDRLPASVVLVLFLAAVASLTMLGDGQGAAGERRLGQVVVFTVLVCLVIWVTLDLNQPRRGLITVSQEPMQRLLAGMDK